MENPTAKTEQTFDQSPYQDRYHLVRSRTEGICSHLELEDYVVQPVLDVSPPKWHLAHTTWFFETFVLKRFFEGYREFHPDYGYHFNSYYNTIGNRVLRSDRGLMTRPSTEDIYRYRRHVDDSMQLFLKTGSPDNEALETLELGLQHEMQHQELLLTDIKFILGHQPSFPVYHEKADFDRRKVSGVSNWIRIEEGLYEIGYRSEKGFCFDNEKGAHKVFLHEFEISTEPVSFGDYLEFIDAGGYSDFRFWHSDAWDFIKKNEIKAPLYMHEIDGEWHRYTMSGLKRIDPKEILIHVSYYEAFAFAEWKGLRLPTEFEWEVASERFKWGDCWEWTNSAYLPYPGFRKPAGALGEYNGKFMVNQMVLRGASSATFPGHSRNTYRNFFHPWLQWQYAGIRLAR